MFVQIIEGRTSKPEELRAAGETWKQQLGPGAAGYLGTTSGTTADGKAITIVRFEDEAAARANSERPEQGEWYEQHLVGLYDEPPTFTESGDTTDFMGGGSDDAGFVQVMKSTGVDRAEIERLDAIFESFVGDRPDILGGVRVWTGPDSCTDVTYFSSEAEARKGEQAEMPDELKQAMGDFQMAGDTEYLDLTEPQLL